MKLARKKIILLIAVILAISMIFYFRHHKPANDYPKPAVTTEVLKTETSRDALQAVGTLKASDSVNIVSQVSGVVKTIAFHSGQTVKQGQILATLEDDDLQATLKEAEAKADNAADYLSRMKKLAPSESIAKVELDKAAADSKAASAEVEFDTAKLNQFTITAPFDGMLGIRQISQGQYLKPGDSVVNCESLSPMHVDFNVPENEASHIHVGDSIQFSISADPGRTFSGILSASNTRVDELNRTILLRATVPNVDGVLLSGMSAVLNLFSANASVLKIPETALVFTPDGPSAFVVDAKNIAHQKPVTLGLHQDDLVVIQKGLNAGETLVVDGAQKLHEGSVVDIQKAGNV